jgi:TnpA family transposase
MSFQLIKFIDVTALFTRGNPICHRSPSQPQDDHLAAGVMSVGIGPTSVSTCRPLICAVQEGLNVVERWNAVTDFLCYGRQGIFATNSREQLEISTLCLQLLQNCLMLINMLLVERTMAQHQLLEHLSEEDRRALSPLFYEHVNPYGLFALDLDRPSWLEAA